MDADMSAELTDHLFQQDDEKFGLDLVRECEPKMLMIHMLSSDFVLSRLASTSKGVEIMVLHHTLGRYIHQGSRLIYFQFLLSLTSWRELCGLSAVKSWKMLAKIFPENIVPRLQAIYDKVGGWSN